MPASQDHVTPTTPMGANLVADGATFRVWAPRAQEVYVEYDGHWDRNDLNVLVNDAEGYWAGFIPGVKEGTEYKIFVRGTGRSNLKHDPYARELAFRPPYPYGNCVVRSPDAFPWHDQDFRPPPFNDLVIYQFHVGTFVAPHAAAGTYGRFLDVLGKLPYLVELGVNALEPLPVIEYPAEYSEGYNGTDMFSPEMAYASDDPAELDAYLAAVNGLLARKGAAPFQRADLAGSMNQLKVFVDVCHVYGLAVLLDVVYNHAGGFEGDDNESIYFFDNVASQDNNDSLYFTDQPYVGGLVFAFWKQEVRQFLIDNARFFLAEHHADGFRYDEVSKIVRSSPDGWRFCRDLTQTVRADKPAAVQIAEYWQVNPAVVTDVNGGGAGFDATWSDRLRDSVREAVGKAAAGRDSQVDLDSVADSLRGIGGFPAAWKAVQYLESHDEVHVTASTPRVARLADPGDARSWYARSRARVATGLLLTAPGIPMLFMGEEFLEDKPWDDNLSHGTGSLIWWDGLAQGQKPMVDHLRFTRELIALRRAQPALRGERIYVFHVHDANRVIAFHRWLDGVGQDVVVVASLNESTFAGYPLGFPLRGRWREAFNSDVYDNWVNPWVAGNGGGVAADGGPLHGLPASASIVLPANGLLVFTRDFAG